MTGKPDLLVIMGNTPDASSSQYGYNMDTNMNKHQNPKSRRSQHPHKHQKSNSDQVYTMGQSKKHNRSNSMNKIPPKKKLKSKRYRPMPDLPALLDSPKEHSIDRASSTEPSYVRNSSVIAIKNRSRDNSSLLFPPKDLSQSRLYSELKYHTDRVLHNSQLDVPPPPPLNPNKTAPETYAPNQQILVPISTTTNSFMDSLDVTKTDTLCAKIILAGDIFIYDGNHMKISTLAKNESSWYNIFGKVRTKKNGEYHWKLRVSSDASGSTSKATVVIGVLDATFTECYRASNQLTVNSQIYTDRERGYGVKPCGILTNYGKDCGQYCISWNSASKNNSRDVVLDLYVNTKDYTLGYGLNGDDYPNLYNIDKDANYKLAIGLYGSYQTVEILEFNTDQLHQHHEEEKHNQPDEQILRDISLTIDDNDVDNIKQLLAFGYSRNSIIDAMAHVPNKQDMTEIVDYLGKHEVYVANLPPIPTEVRRASSCDITSLHKNIAQKSDTTNKDEDIEDIQKSPQSQAWSCNRCNASNSKQAQICLLCSSPSFSSSGDSKEDAQEMNGPNKQFYNFLKDNRLDKYYNKFAENECNDIRDAQYVDENMLRNDIGMRTIECRRFLGKTQELKNDMDTFKSSNIIPSIIIKRLAEFGIVTMDILCAEIQDKSHLKSKLNITNDNQCDLLWNIIENQSQFQSNINVEQRKKKSEIDKGMVEGINVHGIVDTSYR